MSAIIKNAVYGNRSPLTLKGTEVEWRGFWEKRRVYEFLAENEEDIGTRRLQEAAKIRELPENLT